MSELRSSSRIARSHYELAFEAYLNHRGTPYVSVEEVRHHVPGRMGIKSFDYIVYPAVGRACLVDVKGRKCPVKNWVTEADLKGLSEWQSIFGSDFEAVFVFAYWLAPTSSTTDPVVAILPGAWQFAGRSYEYHLIPLTSYAQHARVLSVRWETVSIPSARFQEAAVPLSRAWEAAPC